MVATNTTPVSLLERLRKSEDSTAWNRFVALYTPLLYHWLQNAGLTSEDAADLVQDVFTKLLTLLPHFKYDPSKSFHGWLRTITLNSRRDLLRRQKPTAGLEADVWSPDPIDSFIEREYRSKLALRAMQILRADFHPQTWQAVWDLVVEGRAAADIAGQTGMTIQAVYAAKCRVLARLRQELQGLWC